MLISKIEEEEEEEEVESIVELKVQSDAWRTRGRPEY